MKGRCSPPAHTPVSAVTGPSDWLPRMQTQRGSPVPPLFFPKGNHGGFKDSSLPVPCLRAALRAQETPTDRHFSAHLENMSKMKGL